MYPYWKEPRGGYARNQSFQPPGNYTLDQSFHPRGGYMRNQSYQPPGTYGRNQRFQPPDENAYTASPADRAFDLVECPRSQHFESKEHAEAFIRDRLVGKKFSIRATRDVDSIAQDYREVIAKVRIRCEQERRLTYPTFTNAAATPTLKPAQGLTQDPALTDNSIQFNTHCAPNANRGSKLQNISASGHPSQSTLHLRPFERDRAQDELFATAHMDFDELIRVPHGAHQSLKTSSSTNFTPFEAGAVSADNLRPAAPSRGQNFLHMISDTKADLSTAENRQMPTNAVNAEAWRIVPTDLKTYGLVSNGLLEAHGPSVGGEKRESAQRDVVGVQLSDRPSHGEQTQESRTTPPRRFQEPLQMPSPREPEKRPLDTATGPATAKRKRSDTTEVPNWQPHDPATGRVHRHHQALLGEATRQLGSEPGVEKLEAAAGSTTDAQTKGGDLSRHGTKEGQEEIRNAAIAVDDSKLERRTGKDSKTPSAATDGHGYTTPLKQIRCMSIAHKYPEGRGPSKAQWVV